VTNVDIAVREDDIPPNPDDDEECKSLGLYANEVPSLHHPLQSLHNRPPSPPQFRDLGLPTLETRRPEALVPPSSVLGTIPDSIAAGHEVPFRDELGIGLGRRIPQRTEGLEIQPGRHVNGGRQPPSWH